MRGGELLYLEVRIVDTNHRHPGRQGFRVEDLPVVAGHWQPDNTDHQPTPGQASQLVLLVSVVEEDVHHDSINIR